MLPCRPRLYVSSQGGTTCHGQAALGIAIRHGPPYLLHISAPLSMYVTRDLSLSDISTFQIVIASFLALLLAECGCMLTTRRRSACEHGESADGLTVLRQVLELSVKLVRGTAIFHLPVTGCGRGWEEEIAETGCMCRKQNPESAEAGSRLQRYSAQVSTSQSQHRVRGGL